MRAPGELSPDSVFDGRTAAELPPCEANGITLPEALLAGDSRLDILAGSALSSDSVDIMDIDDGQEAADSSMGWQPVAAEIERLRSRELRSPGDTDDRDHAPEPPDHNDGNRGNWPGEFGDNGEDEGRRAIRTARLDAAREAVTRLHGIEDVSSLESDQAAPVAATLANLAVLAAQDGSLAAVEASVNVLKNLPQNIDTLIALVRANTAGTALDDPASRETLVNLLEAERLSNLHTMPHEYHGLVAAIETCADTDVAPERLITEYGLNKSERWLLTRDYLHDLAVDKGDNAARIALNDYLSVFIRDGLSEFPAHFVYERSNEVFDMVTNPEFTRGYIVEQFVNAGRRLEPATLNWMNLEIAMDMGERLLRETGPGSLFKALYLQQINGLVTEFSERISSGERSVSSDELLGDRVALSQLQAAWNAKLAALTGTMPEDIISQVDSHAGNWVGAELLQPFQNSSIIWRNNALRAAAVQYMRADTPADIRAARTIAEQFADGQLDTYLECWQAARSEEALQTMAPSPQLLTMAADAGLLFDTAGLLRGHDTEAMAERLLYLANEARAVPPEPDPDRPQSVTNVLAHLRFITRLADRIETLAPEQLPPTLCDVIPMLQNVDSPHLSLNKYLRDFYKKIIKYSQDPGDYAKVHGFMAEPDGAAEAPAVVAENLTELALWLSQRLRPESDMDA